MLCTGLRNSLCSNQIFTYKVASAAVAWSCDKHKTLRVMSGGTDDYMHACALGTQRVNDIIINIMLYYCQLIINHFCPILFSKKINAQILS